MYKQVEIKDERGEVVYLSEPMPSFKAMSEMYMILDKIDDKSRVSLVDSEVPR